MKTKLLLSFFLWFLCLPPAFAAVTGQTVEYRDGRTVLEGYLAYDDAVPGKRPAVMVVPEWNGLNDYAKKRADQLAGMGYVGFAVDMYGKGIHAETHEEAAKLSRVYFKDRKRMRRRAKAAYDFLLKQEWVDPARVAAIGYCFGGTTVLEMARAGWPLAGVASFHGFMGTSLPAEKDTVHAAIRVFHGDEDSFSDSDLEGFRREMRTAGADFSITILSGSVHRFTVPEAGSDKSTGMAYSPRADHESWQALLDFLKEIFK